MSESNPHIDYENYYKEYNQNIDNLKNRKEIIEMDKLCYSVFENNQDGKKLLESWLERFLIGSMPYKNSSELERIEGFREFVRMVRNSVLSYRQRIDSTIDEESGE